MSTAIVELRSIPLNYKKQYSVWIKRMNAVQDSILIYVSAPAIV